MIFLRGDVACFAMRQPSLIFQFRGYKNLTEGAVSVPLKALWIEYPLSPCQVQAFPVELIGQHQPEKKFVISRV